MELAYNRSTRNSDTLLGQNPDLRADLNYRLPGGSLNPYFFGHGYYFSQQNFLRLNRVKSNDTVRASFSYEKDLARWGVHRFAVLGERNTAHESRLRMREVWANRPFGGQPEAAANQVARRRYFQIGGPSANYTSGFQPGNPFNRDSFRSAFANIGAITTSWAPPNDRDFDDEITTDSTMAVMQNYLFNRRLVTTVGLRDDTITSVGPRTLRDPATGLFRFAGPADQAVFTPTQKEWFSRDEQRGIRRTYGAVFHLTRNFSLTANYSNGVQLPERNRSVLPNDETPPPVRGQGYDVGLAFSFLDNRISGSIKKYESKSLGERTQGGVEAVFVNPNNDVMSSFDRYFRLAGLTTFGATDPIKSIGDLTSIYFSAADSFLGDRISQGTEFEVVANPTRNWTLRGGYSYTDRTKTNIMYEAVPWWAERVALWKSLDTLYTTRTGRPSIYNQLLFDRNQATGTITVAQRIAQSDTELATLRLEEQQAYGNRPHKANVWTRYTFSTGRLKGFAAGGGWRYQSANVAGVQLSTGRQLLGNARSLGDLFFQYKTKNLFGTFEGRTNVTYQLNVTNFLDDRTINATKLDVDTVSGVIFARRAFREDPRVFAFTVRTEF